MLSDRCMYLLAPSAAAAHRKSCCAPLVTYNQSLRVTILRCEDDIIAQGRQDAAQLALQAATMLDISMQAGSN